MRIAEYDDYLRVLRGLLLGDAVEYAPHGARPGATRPIKMLIREKKYMSLEPRIPLYVSAFGPRAMELAGEHGDGHLQRGGVVMRAELACFFDSQARAVPKGAFLVAHQQHAQFVHAARDLVHHQALARLHFPVPAGHFMHRQHSIVARVIGVMHGRAVHHLVTLLDAVIVGDRDGFVMRDQETVERAFQRGPGAHLGAGAGTQQEDRGVDDEGDIGEARPRGYIGEVGHP